jgi:Selenocysteine-specific translation elongation factor
VHVVATAGHVDHGKSTLVRALTGMEPDRYAEERRRGLTIDLGFAWTTLASGTEMAFVDVPGHARFVPPDWAGEALLRLGTLPQPFTLSDARLALDTTRRVAVPVLEALDAARRTRRLDGSRRVVVGVG